VKPEYMEFRKSSKLAVYLEYSQIISRLN